MQPKEPNTIAEDRTAHSAPRPHRNGAGPVDSAWTFVDCGRTLYRRKQTVLSIAACGLLIAALAGVLQTPMYQSRASIQIQALNENFLSLRDIYPTAVPGADNPVYIQTQAEILRQDALLEQVVRKLQLDQRPEFRPNWRSTLTGDPSTALDEIKKHVQVVPMRGSSIIQIVCEAREPQLAADLANTLAQTFIDQSVEARQHSARQTQASLSLEREAIRKKLLQSELDLDAAGSRPRGSVAYNQMRREFDANRQFYQSISQRIDEARIASGMVQSNVRLVAAARPAALPYKPNLPLLLVLGGIGGLIVAIGFVMLREQTSSALRVPGDAGACLSIPELGAIPKAEGHRFAAFGFGNGAPAIPVERISLEQSSSGVSESFRAATASILSMGSNGSHPRVLVVTSSRPGEGKTTVVSNLAIALADAGGKVLLIDGDLRRPRLHKIFEQANSWGMSDLLREKNAIEDVPIERLVKRTAVARLHLLPGGTSAENIFALLSSGRIVRLLSRVREAYDYVLIDAPPCLEFADARILGRHAEKLILVVRADYTGKETAQAAVQRLNMDGIPIMGVIFNCWDSSNSGIYGYKLYRQEFA